MRGLTRREGIGQEAVERRTEILKNITKTQKGIEVGPWFSPLAPKQKGYNCLSLDVFDTETLKERAKTDPLVADNKIPLIEPVDLIGTATDRPDRRGARRTRHIRLHHLLAQFRAFAEPDQIPERLWPGSEAGRLFVDGDTG
jgi:hypothetical protein